MSTTTTQLSCPDCPDGRAPRAAFEDANGWAGACPRHKMHWRLAGEPPADAPRIKSLRGYRDLDAEAAQVRAITDAGFRQIPVLAGVAFWMHPERPETVTTDEAFEIAQEMIDRG